MNKIIFLAFCYLLTFSLFSCQSSNSFRVPGETGLISKNICSEYMNIADSYFELKKYDKAITYYKLAMNDKNLKLSVYYKLGRTYALSKDYVNASKIYSDLLKLDPQNKDLQISLAYVKAMSGEVSESLGMYERLCQSFPNDAVVFENYINILLFLEKKEEAYAQYKIFAQKFPDNANLKVLEEKTKPAQELTTEISDNENNQLPNY